MTSARFQLSSDGGVTWLAAGAPLAGGNAITSGAGTQSIKARLESLSGVSSVAWDIVAGCDNGEVLTLTTNVDKSVSFLVPRTTPGAYLLRARVNGGLVAADVSVLAIKVLTDANLSILATGETNEADSAFGWTKAINDAIRFIDPGGGPGVAMRLRSGSSAYLTGDVTIAQGSGITLSQSGQTITITAAGGASQYATPEEFGAVGDGTADDTAAVQDALDDARPTLLTKAYKTTSTLTMSTADKVVVCDGGRLVLTGAYAGIAATAKVALHGLRIVGSGFSATETAQDGIILDGARGSLIADLYTSNLGGYAVSGRNLNPVGSPILGGATVSNPRVHTGFGGIEVITRGEYVSVTNPHIEATKVGLSIAAGNISVVGGKIDYVLDAILIGAGTNGEHGLIEGVQINHTTRYVFVINGALPNGFRVLNTYTYDGSIFLIGDTRGINFEGCHFDNCVFNFASMASTARVHFDGTKWGEQPCSMTGAPPLAANLTQTNGTDFLSGQPSAGPLVVNTTGIHAPWTATIDASKNLTIAAPTVTNANGANATIKGQNAHETGAAASWEGGSVTIEGGDTDATDAGIPGYARVLGGNTGGLGGGRAWVQGASGIYTGGEAVVQGGNASYADGAGGSISVLGGDGGTGSGAFGGPVAITGGTASGGQGGTLYLTGGAGRLPGDVVIVGGEHTAGTDEAGGSVIVRGGAGNANYGGRIALFGGEGLAGNGGDIELFVGVDTTGGYGHGVYTLGISGAEGTPTATRNFSRTHLAEPATTANATPVAHFSAIVPDHCVYTIVTISQARTVSAGDAGVIARRSTWRRNGASVTQVGTTKALTESDEDNGFNVTHTASTATVSANAVGKAATTVHWRHTVQVIMHSVGS